MKSSKFDIEEDSKKKTSAANHFPSSSKMAPPKFALNNASAPDTQSQSSSSQSGLMAAENNFQLPEQESHSNANESDSQNEQDNEISQTHATINPNHLFKALKYAHDIFRTTSRLTNVNIQGGQAIGGPGCLQGSRLKSMMMTNNKLQGHQGANRDMIKAVTEVMDEEFEMWRNTVAVPALLWYPMFIAFPAPMAPPMPNVPARLAEISFMDHLLTNASNIGQKIMNRLPNEMHNGSNAEIIESFSTQAASHFDFWFQTQFITMALGTGSVPGYNPIFRPAGPVHGHVIPIVGILR